MQEATAKERMLKKIRKALIEKVENPFPKLEEDGSIFHKAEEILEIQFAMEFAKINGQFVFCENENQFRKNLEAIAAEKNWQNIFCWEQTIIDIISNSISYSNSEVNFENAEVGITSCEALIARTGSVLISNESESGRRLSIYPSTHVVVAFTSQLLYDIADGISFLKEKYQGNLPSLISNTAGPSRTADIEKTLVLGAHGPRELFVFLIDNTIL